MTSMAGYTKLFNSILASTIWEADMPTRIVWITLLAMADKDGIAEASVPGLATFARVSREECERALAHLMAPDKDSRSKEHDGRRIEAIDGGWRLLNHAKYRAKLNADERREYLRVKQQEYRRKQKPSTNVNNVSYKSTVLTQAEAEADTKADQKPSPAKAPPDPRVKEFLTWFKAEYETRRTGATYFVNWPKEAPLVKRLLTTYSPERLQRHAKILLTTDDGWIDGTDRGVGILAAKINWLEERLATWEAKQAAKASA